MVKMQTVLQFVFKKFNTLCSISDHTHAHDYLI